MTENNEEYEEIVLKFPKGTGMKERYIPEKEDKVYSYNDPQKAGIILDPETNQPANGILKYYYNNGQLQYEGILVNGLPLGRFYAYFENGNLAELRQFVKKSRAVHGFHVYYGYKTGKITQILYCGSISGYIKKSIYNQGKVIYEYDEVVF